MSSPTITRRMHPDTSADKESLSGARSLRVLLVGSVALGALLLTSAIALTAWRAAEAYLSSEADTHLRDAADRARLVIDRTLLERERQVSMIAAMPAIVDAAREGARQADAMGLRGVPVADLERRFAESRALPTSERARRFLRDRLGPLGFAEVIVTDANGFNALTSGRSSDFVQHDEAWWKTAFADGALPVEVELDESAGQPVLVMASAIREGTSDRPTGVVKVAFSIAALDEIIARAAHDEASLDVIDATGRVVTSSAGVPRLTELAGATAYTAAGESTVHVDVGAGIDRQRATVRAVNGGTWRVVAHVDESTVLAPLAHARPWVIAAVVVLLLLAVAATWLSGRFVERRISRPIIELTGVAEAVAAGDLSRTFTATRAHDEVGRLGRANVRMIADLRRLVSALQQSARETSARAGEITSGSDSMASAAQQMSETSSDLSRQSTEMAEAIQGMALDAARLRAVADDLAGGVGTGVQRNAELITMAGENRTRLDASAGALESLAVDARASADAVAELANASQEFRNFVTLVQKMAKQSRLLALNAAMEAARAGEHGQGFAVVAAEVRRLASNSAEAAERTEALVLDVLGRIESSRESSARTVDTVATVLEATREGLDSYARIEAAVRDSEEWTSAIEQASHQSRGLVGEMTERLDELARATESYAAAMQEVAATSEEQSASTEEIAAAAAHLASAAEQLAGQVSRFRLDAGGPAAGDTGAPASARHQALARDALAAPVPALGMA
ncbi:MAG TPA: methyl-accepting chemotaxis protein [Gemmatimonadaceae bacterium]|nr:methyl-accepting chemotaxis protein [Gemmatimonadaceae bacterium]